MNNKNLKRFYFQCVPEQDDGEWDFDAVIIVSADVWDSEGVWDDSDPMLEFVNDSVLSQEMECVYCPVVGIEDARKWLLEFGVKERTNLV